MDGCPSITRRPTGAASIAPRAPIRHAHRLGGAIFAFLIEKRGRSGSTRTVESYARMLWPFFRVKIPDQVGLRTRSPASGPVISASRARPSSTATGARVGSVGGRCSGARTPPAACARDPLDPQAHHRQAAVGRSGHRTTDPYSGDRLPAKVARVRPRCPGGLRRAEAGNGHSFFPNPSVSARPTGRASVPGSSPAGHAVSGRDGASRGAGGARSSGRSRSRARRPRGQVSPRAIRS